MQGVLLDTVPLIFNASITFSGVWLLHAFDVTVSTRLAPGARPHSPETSCVLSTNIPRLLRVTQSCSGTLSRLEGEGNLGMVNLHKEVISDKIGRIDLLKEGKIEKLLKVGKVSGRCSCIGGSYLSHEAANLRVLKVHSRHRKQVVFQ